jgi:hypothetical protein
MTTIAHTLELLRTGTAPVARVRRRSVDAA